MIAIPEDTPAAARQPLRALLDAAEPPTLADLEERVEAYQAWAVEACRERAFEELEEELTAELEQLHQQLEEARQWRATDDQALAEIWELFQSL